MRHPSHHQPSTTACDRSVLLAAAIPSVHSQHRNNAYRPRSFSTVLVVEAFLDDRAELGPEGLVVLAAILAEALERVEHLARDAFLDLAELRSPSSQVSVME